MIRTTSGSADNRARKERQDVMAFNITTAAAIASLAKTTFDVANALLRGELDHDTMLRNIKAAIAAARDQIIQFMLSLRLDDLQGDVDGLLITFEAYDPFPDGGGNPIPSEEERLRNVIDDAAGVLGDLGAHIQNQPDLDFVFGSVSLLATVVSLRAAAMVERTLTYGINDVRDIPSMLNRGRDLLEIVRQKSDSRFGPIKVGRRTEPGFRVVGYEFEGTFQEILDVSVNSAGVPTRPFPPFVKATRERHLETAFKAIPGVTELSEFRLS